MIFFIVDGGTLLEFGQLLFWYIMTSGVFSFSSRAIIMKLILCITVACMQCTEPPLEEPCPYSNH